MSELYFPSLSAQDKAGEAPSSAAELQGALCGLLCVDETANRNQWHNKIFPDFHPPEEELHYLTDLFDDTIQSLNSLDFNFEMALPDTPLVSRLEAISDWCHGFIYALGISGLTDDIELSKECHEYINDLVNASRVSFDDIEDTEEEQANCEELVEYIRMGLFLLYGELQPVNPEQYDMEH